MTLTPGTKLGAYEILAPIGKGGMGEVYRARDTKLGRDVAVKVLPEALAEVRERLERFEREARLLAQLNHTNVATLYGVEEHRGRQLILMELVEGETLAERIARGPIDLEETLLTFIQIAQGLEAAHEKGVIHRDLKPANIKITPDGKIKILDFGLAKALAPDEDDAAETSQSPTLTKGTALGTILGTASYMSPEQARGKPIDARSDIWSFGCCLYEALTGARAFPGDTVSDVLAGVLKTDPDWDALPALPVRVDIVLRQCLRKDRAKRLQHTIDGRLMLEDAAHEPLPPRTAVPSPSRPRWGSRVTMAVSLGIAAVALWSLLTGSESASDPPRVRRLSIGLPEEGAFSDLGNLAASSVALSPDGNTLAYTASVGGAQQLFLRPLDADTATAVDGTEGATQPFFSPDGEWVGFVTHRGIAKVPVRGGLPVVIADIGDIGGVRIIVGASWGADGEIFFSSMDLGLVKIHEDGGPAEIVLAPNASENEVHIHHPEVLPDGDTVLVTVGRSQGQGRSIEALSLLDGARRKILDDARHPTYAASGHLFFERDDRMMGTLFDVEALELKGAPFLAVDDVHRGKDFAVSDDGTLVYVSGDYEANRTVRLLWVDREGTAKPFGEPARYGRTSGPRLSPDGTRLAVANMAEDGPDIWVLDLQTQAFQRITVSPGPSGAVSPLWSPEGDTLYFRSDRADGIWRTYAAPSDGSRPGQELSEYESGRITSIVPDGRWLLMELGLDIATQRTDVDREPSIVLESIFDEHSPMLSPDGRWLAYVSNESGREEVYVRSFPDMERKWPVSVNGGNEPMWSKDGTELFYRRGEAMMAVAVSGGEGFRASLPRKLFDGNFRRAVLHRSALYDVHPDGNRFVMVEGGVSGAFPDAIQIVLNWDEALKRLVPVE